jgi:ribonuclease J
LTDTPVRILPLGGVGEIGKNCMLIETDDDAIIIDCGLQFPDESMLGVDLVIPDVSYLQNKRDTLRAIFITHGHEDHIGALPYILPELDVPVYATSLAHGLIASKLREHRLLDESTLRIMTPGDVIKVGSFEVEPFYVSHSIPDAVGIAVHTPGGTIVHSGDFKFDETPVNGQTIDQEHLADLGERGVLALLSDCVRVENPGYTPSEQIIGDAFDRIIAERTGRVIIATFASNISRVQQAVDVAERYGRKVALVGRSLITNCGVATELGFLHANGTLIRVEETKKLPPNEVLLITTGSQGEPTSALSRIAGNDHRQIKLVPGDTVIVSATPIPGNEESVGHTIDKLLRLGAEVIYEPLSKVHVSGHASREELKLLIQLLQPRYCVPIHGQYRHMVLYRQAAAEVGVPAEDVPLIEVGDVLELTEEQARVIEHIPVSSVLVDGVTVGTTTDVVLRDRRHLSRDGVVIVVVTIDRMTGELISNPEIVTRGMAHPASADADVIEEVRQRVREVIVSIAAGEVDHAFLTQKLRGEIGEFIFRRLRSHPVVLPVVSEI